MGPLIAFSGARHGRPRDGIFHEVVGPAESRAATDEQTILRLQVPGDSSEVFATIRCALTGDDRGGKAGIHPENDPGVEVVSDWFRAV